MRNGIHLVPTVISFYSTPTGRDWIQPSDASEHDVKSMLWRIETGILEICNSEVEQVESVNYKAQSKLRSPIDYHRFRLRLREATAACEHRFKL